MEEMRIKLKTSYLNTMSNLVILPRYDVKLSIVPKVETFRIYHFKKSFDTTSTKNIKNCKGIKCSFVFP